MPYKDRKKETVFLIFFSTLSTGKHKNNKIILFIVRNRGCGYVDKKIINSSYFEIK